MGLSFLIKKESIAMLISTFVLVFMIFFSGFLLPIERMTPISARIAQAFPENLAIQAFKIIVFYNQDKITIIPHIMGLLVWCGFCFCAATLIKYVRKV